MSTFNYDEEMDNLLNDILSSDLGDINTNTNNTTNNQEPHEALFTLIGYNLSMPREYERFSRTFDEALGLSEGDVNPSLIVYNELDSEHQESIRENKVAEARINDIVRVTGVLLSALEFKQQHGMSYRDFILTRWDESALTIPFEDSEEVLVEGSEPVTDSVAIEEPIEEPEPRPQPRRRLPNDYGLAWDIYEKGYTTADVGKILSLTGGSIARGIRNLGHEMRTGGETQRMRKVPLSEFDESLVTRIKEELALKYETEEEQNDKLYEVFSVNLYDLVEEEADDSIDLEDVREQLLCEEGYKRKEDLTLTSKVKELYNHLQGVTTELFGGLNLDLGALELGLKVNYENGVGIRLRDIKRLDEKSLKIENVTVSVNLTEYIVSLYGRELEILFNRFRFITSQLFKGAEVSQLGNRMVVGIDESNIK